MAQAGANDAIHQPSANLVTVISQAQWPSYNRTRIRYRLNQKDSNADAFAGFCSPLRAAGMPSQKNRGRITKQSVDSVEFDPSPNQEFDRELPTLLWRCRRLPVWMRRI